MHMVCNLDGQTALHLGIVPSALDLSVGALDHFSNLFIIGIAKLKVKRLNALGHAGFTRGAGNGDDAFAQEPGEAELGGGDAEGGGKIGPFVGQDEVLLKGLLLSMCQFPVETAKGKLTPGWNRSKRRRRSSFGMSSKDLIEPVRKPVRHCWTRCSPS